jgi:hypothetical protein
MMLSEIPGSQEESGAHAAVIWWERKNGASE